MRMCSYYQAKPQINMTDEWSMIGVEDRRIGGLEEQRSGVDGTILQQHERIVAQESWNSGVKERTNWQGRKRQGPKGNRQPWLKKSNSYLDPNQGTSSSASCRDRLRNIKFTEEENDVLVTKVLENYRKLYGEDASRTSSFEKKRIWRGILEAINCLGVSVRNMDTCKKRFADCKRFVRAKMSKHWRHAGRRSAMNVYYAEWEEKIKAIICPLGEAIPGVIDSADPCTYECPGHWSPLESVSPEAQLSPDENITPEVQFYSDSQISAEPKSQGENEEWQSFREEAPLNVKEEGEAAALPVPQVEDENQHQETFSSSQQWEEQPLEEPVYPDMDRLLLQSQDAFRRSLRRQLHAVRQELREFRRDHTERMDLLLTLHREHIIVEEQRNEILSQLVTTVSNLASKLSTGDACKPQQYSQPPLAATSLSTGENSSTRTGASLQTAPRYPSRQLTEDPRRHVVHRKKKFALHHGSIANKRRK
ncbi:uncharacterized protein LOC108699302 isoform X2 [Xenopus laevis]|uniref:Myb/SANT-like DNA-binding domain-containing protein n=2 Tax=Xenopus laevis TaxID=8355 RepID=A0A974H8N9_XENLA|nr:uncharacterized protein LOC108699302 isoform X2 [Xenopus laevis]OCT68884.1 hypothetical protein XELAEV_18040192mg [Xenopus laevis]